MPAWHKQAHDVCVYVCVRVFVCVWRGGGDFVCVFMCACACASQLPIYAFPKCKSHRKEPHAHCHGCHVNYQEQIGIMVTTSFSHLLHTRKQKR